MASIIKTSINLNNIPKDKIYNGKKGKYPTDYNWPNLGGQPKKYLYQQHQIGKTNIIDGLYM